MLHSNLCTKFLKALIHFLNAVILLALKVFCGKRILQFKSLAERKQPFLFLKMKLFLFSWWLLLQAVQDFRETSWALLSFRSLHVLCDFIDLFFFHQMSLFQAEKHNPLLSHPVEYSGISSSCLPLPPAIFFRVSGWYGGMDTRNGWSRFKR